MILAQQGSAKGDFRELERRRSDSGFRAAKGSTRPWPTWKIRTKEKKVLTYTFVGIECLYTVALFFFKADLEDEKEFYRNE